MMRALLVCFDAADMQPLAQFANQLGVGFDVLIFGSTAEALDGAKVWDAGTSVPTADVLAASIFKAPMSYSHYAAVSSMASKDAMARLAGLLDAAMVTDVISVETQTTFKRPIVAGTLIETVEVLAQPCVFTVRSAGFPGSNSTSTASVESLPLEASQGTQRLQASAKSGGRPDLTQASVVVSGGRPLKDAHTFEAVIGGLADKLGGAVGATRAAVDSGIAPNECQVGQTGKIVAPELYIAAGISGSTQHMAGIKDSKVIVAINKDPDAPIFEFADFGLVADLFEAIPEISSKVRS